MLRNITFWSFVFSLVALFLTLTGVGNEYLGFAVFYAALILISIAGLKEIAPRLEWQLKMLMLVMFWAIVVAVTWPSIDQFVQEKLASQLCQFHVLPPIFPVVNFTAPAPQQASAQSPTGPSCENALRFAQRDSRTISPQVPFEEMATIYPRPFSKFFMGVRLYTTSPMWGGTVVRIVVRPNDGSSIAAGLDPLPRIYGTKWVDVFVRDKTKFLSSPEVVVLLRSPEPSKVWCVQYLTTDIPLLKPTTKR
jgi:hypothetical protein